MLQQQQQSAPPPGFAANSGDAAAEVREDGGGEESERASGSGKNRWPRQETLALLKIRSEMDAEFKDSSLKGPLWEEVSRKLGEMGYHRNAKKCKEKFENVYKYHKRTKDGRTTKPDGKTYRFFEELQALDTHAPSQAPTVGATASMLPTTIPVGTHTGTVLSTPNPMTTSGHMFQTNINVSADPVPSIRVGDVPSISLSNSTSSSSTFSDEQRGERRRKRKRKWKDFFGSLMGEVIKKQDELQKKFLDALEKRERDRMIREDAWRVQEMNRIKREHELLVQERSLAATKDAAIVAFLQKISEQQNNPIAIPQLQQLQFQIQSAVPPSPPPPPQAPIARPLQPQSDGTENLQAPAPSRWPKAEIEALIELRKDLDNKYNETSPKGPLWEDISAGMRRLGYNRNAKRCKEKWENINKYYKKVKESNKKRPEDAKTCPYFHQLDALYKQKSKSSYGSTSTPMVPMMVQPEQQWPLQQQEQDTEMEDQETDTNDKFDEGDEDDDEEDDNDEDDDGAEYEIVTNKQPSSP